jgi:hypothetical protein
MDYYIVIPNALYMAICCHGYRFCPMHSHYGIEQRLYTDVKCNEPWPFSCCGWRYSGVLKLCNRTELHMDVKCVAWTAKDNTLMRMRMTDDDE